MRRPQFLLMCLLLGPLLTGFAQEAPVSGPFVSNPSRQIGVRLNGFTNFMHWQTTEFIDYRYQLRPFLTGAVGLILREPITNRLSLEAGLSIVQLGMSSTVGRNYQPNQRITANRSDRSKYLMFVLPVHLLYRFNRQNAATGKYLLLGANVYYNGVDDINTNRFGVSVGTTKDIDTNDTIVVTNRRQSLTRFAPAVVIGTGWQKRWSKRSAVDVRLTGSVGLAPLIQTFLTVAVHNQSRYKTPYSSTNELVNRGTYVGIDLCYLFSFR